VDLAGQLAICRLDPCERYEDGEVSSRMLLWEDPLMGLYRRTLLARDDVQGFSPARYYGDLAVELREGLDRATAEHGGHIGAGDLEFAYALARAVALKAALYDGLVDAYGRKGRNALALLAEDSIPELLGAVEALWRRHRTVWMAQNKPFGFEVICVRYGGLLLRLKEVSARIAEFLKGTIDRIDELESPAEPLAERIHRYRAAVTPSTIL
jgi:hypothetical protein